MRGRVIAAALAVATLAGCGGGDSGTAVLDAARKTVDAGTATATFRMTGLVEGSGDGRIDFASEETEGEFVYEQFEGLPAGTRAQVYTKGAEQFAVYPDLLGDQWVQLPQDPFGAVSNNPSSLVSGFEVALRDVEEDGEGTSDGVEVTKYTGTFDFEEFAETVPEEDREAAEQALDELPITEVPVDLAVDADGYLRSASFEIAAGEESLVIGADFADFGEPVEFDPPDPDEVVPLDEAIRRRQPRS